MNDRKLFFDVAKDVAFNYPKKKYDYSNNLTDEVSSIYKENPLVDEIDGASVQNIRFASIAIRKREKTKNPISMYRVVAKICRKLKNNDVGLIKVSLSSCGINDEIAIQLAQAIPGNGFLQCLILQNNVITDGGIEALSRALRNSPYVHTLYLGGNRLTDQSIKYLCGLLDVNSIIKDLNLSNRWPASTLTDFDIRHHEFISATGAKLISCQLKKKSSLTRLNLSEQRILDEGAISLFDALEKSNLIGIDLSSNVLTDVCCSTIAVALSLNPGLETCVLGRNGFTDTGVVEIASAMHKNSTLRLLDLSYNKIDRIGLDALFVGIPKCPSLYSINTAGNIASDPRLAWALKYRNSVVTKELSFGTDSSLVNAFDWDAKIMGYHGVRNQNSGGMQGAGGIYDGFGMPSSSSHPLPSVIPRIRSASANRQLSSDMGISHGKENIRGGRGDGMPFSASKDNMSINSNNSGSLSAGGSAISHGERRRRIPSRHSHSTLPRHDISTRVKKSLGNKKKLYPYIDQITKQILMLPVPPGVPNGGGEDDIINRTKSDLVSITRKKREVATIQRTSDHLSKTLSVPRVTKYGTLPVRLHLTTHQDSLQHSLYLRVATPYDAPGQAPYPIVKMWGDQKKERERVESARQTELYQKKKAIALKQTRPTYSDKISERFPIPARFWEELKIVNLQKYPQGIDAAAAETAKVKEQRRLRDIQLVEEKKAKEEEDLKNGIYPSKERL